MAGKQPKAFLQRSRDEQIALVVAEVQRLADGDKGPSMNRFDAQRSRDLPMAKTIDRTLIAWDALLDRAGLRWPDTRRGNWRKNRQYLTAIDRAVVAIGLKNDAAIATHRDERNSWPLLGILRREEVVAEVTLAPGVVQRCIREYIGLR